MIYPVTYYEAKCDNCGIRWQDDFVAMADPDEMEYLLDESEWHIGEEGKHYCPDCFEFDDDDKLVLKPVNQ